MQIGLGPRTVAVGYLKCYKYRKYSDHISNIVILSFMHIIFWLLIYLSTGHGERYFFAFCIWCKSDWPSRNIILSKSQLMFCSYLCLLVSTSHWVIISIPSIAEFHICAFFIAHMLLLRPGVLKSGYLRAIDTVTCKK